MYFRSNAFPMCFPALLKSAVAMIWSRVHSRATRRGTWLATGSQIGGVFPLSPPAQSSDQKRARALGLCRGRDENFSIGPAHRIVCVNNEQCHRLKNHHARTFDCLLTGLELHRPDRALPPPFFESALPQHNPSCRAQAAGYVAHGPTSDFSSAVSIPSSTLTLFIRSLVDD